MLKDFTNYYFWFAQPASVFSSADRLFGYIFLGLTAVSFLFLALAKFGTGHAVIEKALRKFWHLAFPIGLSGLIWYGVRYENTPIFAQRYWAGLNIAVGIIWLLFILKYLIFNFGKEKSEYDREVLKSKYIPGGNKKRT